METNLILKKHIEILNITEQQFLELKKLELHITELKLNYHNGKIKHINYFFWAEKIYNICPILKECNLNLEGSILNHTIIVKKPLGGMILDMYGNGVIVPNF
jgi:hypothetical protein